MKQSIFQDWPIDKFIVWKDPHDEFNESIPVLAELVDNSWVPADLAAIVSYLISGKVHSALVGCEKAQCMFCSNYTFDPSLVRSDGTWNWPDCLSHLVAAHSIRLPDSLLEHIRKEVQSHVGSS